MAKQTDQPVCSRVPADLRICGAAGAIEIEAAAAPADGGGPKLRRFKMTAYTGGPLVLAGVPFPVVVDLAGMRVPASKARPVLKDHNPALIVGHTDDIAVGQSTVKVAGVVSGVGAVAQEVTAASDNGFPWQASIGARAERVIFVPEGREAEANGRMVKGPAYIARRSVLGEISFVAMGADENTSVKVAATAAGSYMEVFARNFEEWVQAQGFTLADLSETQTASLKAAFDTGQGAGKTAVATAEADAAKVVADIRAQAAAETTRVSAVRKVCAGKHDDIEAKAVGDGWDVSRTELEVLRAERPKAPAAHVRDDAPGTDIMAAAVCMTGGLPKIEAVYDEKILDAAGRRFRRGIGLQELLLEAAWANGYTGRTFQDPQAILEAAFSTFALPGILSDVANKFLLAGFESVEDAWRRIAATRNVKDFKTVTSYRLTGGFEYDEVGPGGELKHGTLGEESFQNQARTYGKMFGLTRTDLINDDMGALTATPRRIGRGGALKLNKVFWLKFLDNAAFFTALRGNYAEGAATALTIDGLTAAELLFLEQKDPEGSPLGVTPRVLLVPPALLVRGTQLMQATELRDTTASTKYATNNPHAGKFSVVHSAYLSNTSLTGASSKAWHLLADPNDLPVIEVAFLNGQQTPIVERADADFNILGVQFRGYFDFGVALQDYRGGVKMKGEA